MLILCWLYDIICRFHVDDVDFRIFSPCNFQQVIHTGPICPILSPEDPMMTLSPKRSRPRNGRRAYWGSSPDPIASWCFVDPIPMAHGPTAKHGTTGPTLANAHAVFAMPWTLKSAMRCVASAATASNSGRSRMAKVVKAQAMLPQNGINRWHQGWRLYRQYSFTKYLWRSHLKKCLSSQVK